MRHFVVCWTLGLLSVSSLAGCCCVGDWWEDRCSDCPCMARWRARRSMAQEDDANSARVSRKNGTLIVNNGAGETIVIQTTPEEITMPKKLPAPATPGRAPAAAPLPEAEPLPVIPLPGELKGLPDAPRQPLPVAPPKKESLEFPPRPVPAVEIPLPSARSGATSNAKEEAVAIKGPQIKFGTADEFQSITGQVQQWRKTWRLRYAAIDQEDAFGGSVTLEGSAVELSKLRDGQHVRVRGALIPAEDRAGVTRYRVQTVEILD